MPELPEVESVRTGLEQLVKGARIKQVDVFWPRIISEPDDIERFKHQLTDQKIDSISRRGKFLLFYLTDYVLISHLRMEGKYSVVSQEEPKTKHTHVVFQLSDNRDLRYLDVRKFGRMALVNKGEEFLYPSIQKLGPEPIKEEFFLKNATSFLKTRKKAIKGVLLDQQFVAGVGNIYADEILHKSKIHPETPANQLTKKQLKNLHKMIIQVLGEAVEAGGTTVRSYANAFGQSGTYQQSLVIYGRENLPCTTCGTPIKKIKVVQRGTHFCPKCQQKWRSSHV